MRHAYRFMRLVTFGTGDVADGSVMNSDASSRDIGATHRTGVAYRFQVVPPTFQPIEVGVWCRWGRDDPVFVRLRHSLHS